MVLVPTRRAVIELAGQFGYETVPLAQNIPDYTSMEDYRSQERLAFICAKERRLGGLASEPEPNRNAVARLGSTPGPSRRASGSGAERDGPAPGAHRAHRPFPRWHYEFEFDGGIRTPIDETRDMQPP